MRNNGIGTAIALILLSLTSACNPKPSAPLQTGGGVSGQPIISSATPTKDYEEFDYRNFSHSTIIDNAVYPFKPGTQYIYAGSTQENGETISHRVTITVTDLTKVIDTVPSVVNYILDYSGDQIIEAEVAFFAQDDDGTVWRMGEHPEEFEDGIFIGAPTWIAGIQDAKAGIAMLAHPVAGAPSYSQGWAPGVDFTDRGQVIETGMQVCTPMDCYNDVVIIRETSRAEPNAFQFKYYAPGMYNIRIDWKGEDQKREVMELVRVVHLSPEALSKIHEQVIELEKHAYQVSKDVYALTSPME